MLTPKPILLTFLLLGVTLVAPDAAHAQEVKFPETVTLKDRGEAKLTPTTPLPGCKLQPLEDDEFVTFTPAEDGQSGTLKAKDKGLTTTGNQTTIKLKCKKEPPQPEAPAAAAAEPAAEPADDNQSELASNNIVVKIAARARNLRVVTVKKINGGAQEKEDPIPPDNTLQLIQGETPKVRVVYDGDAGKVAINKVTVTTDSASVVEVASGEPPTLNALHPSDKAATLTVQIEGEAEPRAALGFKARVLGTIASIVVENGQALSLPEGDSVSLRLKITGPNGETYKLSERPDIKIDNKTQGLVSHSIDNDTVTLTAQSVTRANTTSRTEQLQPNVFRTTIDTVAATSSGATPQPGTIEFTTPYGAGGPYTSDPLTVTVTEKFGYITFEPPPRGFLLPGGTFSTTAIVRRKTGEIIYGQGVEFRLENETEDSKWVTLAPEGNKVNVYWADPADPAQARNRPSQVRVNVTAHPVGGGVITGKIFVRMGTVAKFAPLKVKLNVMDQRTANDLYGEVMSDEYYVLTVRLFNNLRDQDTNELTGASILAYSSSIEMAVGMEKKFDNDSDTDFPNVIGKDAARRISQQRNAAAERAAEAQAQADIAAAESAYQELRGATAEQRQAEQEVGLLKEAAYRKVRDAEDKRDAASRLRRRAAAAREEAGRLREEEERLRNRADEAARQVRRARETRRGASAGDDSELTAAAARAERDAAEAKRKADAAEREEAAAVGRAHEGQLAWEQAEDEARMAVRKANAKVDEVGLAYDKTARARASIARANELRTPISQALAMKSDPDTAYDDGRWHTVTPADFVRITRPKEEQDFRQSLYTEKIPESVMTNLTALDQPAAGNGNGGGAPAPDTTPPAVETEPTCNSVTTYRPFTFEMMVNTVDRRDGRSRRTLAFKILEGLGTATSFVTAIAIPPAGNDLPLGLEKYRNLFIPGADRLFPSLKEQNRQNIVSQAMKEIEEIPFGSDITRVIFIPKKPMRGIIKGHETRISEVCPHYFKVEVAIIRKGSGGVVEQGTIAPQQ